MRFRPPLLRTSFVCWHSASCKRRARWCTSSATARRVERFAFFETDGLIRIKQKIRRASEKTYQTTDHLATYRMLEQKCQEWGIKMWTATVDFMKAFDSISHNSIWEALLSCKVDHGYICLLRKIYKDQKASVQTDEESEIFDFQKGSKQGDPMSSLLFNTVLQYALKNVIQRRQKKKGMGSYLSDQDRDCLTNLRFADDVMLFATSKAQIRNMVCEFKDATEKVGLRIHPDKTKILSNQSNMNSDTKRYIKIGEMSIEILAKSESMKYLGQRISFHHNKRLWKSKAGSEQLGRHSTNTDRN